MPARTGCRQIAIACVTATNRRAARDFMEPDTSSLPTCSAIRYRPEGLREVAQGCDGDAGAFADPVRVGAELRFDPEFVVVQVVAGRTAGPADARVDQPVLHVLGDQASNVLRAVRPLVQPPLPAGHRVLEYRHHHRIVESPR